MESKQKFYVLIADQERGPFSLEEVRDLWRSRQLAHETLYAEPGAEDWRPVTDLIEEINVDSHLGFPQPLQRQEPSADSDASERISWSSKLDPLKWFILAAILVGAGYAIYFFTVIDTPAAAHARWVSALTNAAASYVMREWVGAQRIYSLEVIELDQRKAMLRVTADGLNKLGGPVRQSFRVEIIFKAMPGAPWDPEVIRTIGDPKLPVIPIDSIGLDPDSPEYFSPRLLAPS